MFYEHMIKEISVILFFLFSAICYSQKLNIDSELMVKETRIKTKIKNQEYVIGTSVDNKNIDSLVIRFVKFGGGPGIKLIFTDSILPKAYFWADYGKFKGKNSADYNIKYYSLTINKSDLKIGDTIMGKVEFLSQPIEHLKNKPEIFISGEFMHIIGKNIKVFGGKRMIYN